MFMPNVGVTAAGVIGGVPIHMSMSPLCYPMHDHTEPSQTSQGGNYNLGLIAGLNFTGDRNAPGGVRTFPNKPTVFGPKALPGSAETGTGLAAGPEGGGHGG
jgi:hypothetical protein